jgi:hypothetical protein
MIGSGFADPVKSVAHAEMCEKVVKAIVAGKSYAEAAALADLDVRHIHRILAAYAAEVRNRVVDRCHEAFAVQDARLEAMYAHAQKKMDALPADATPSEFCACVKAIVLIFERQARLLGIDREKTVGGGQKVDWLDGASEAELVKWAEKRGLPVPEKFKTLS